ncbi:MAG: acetyl-CoA C-acetyltransferase [Chloroflexi bacterium]|nr:acetyl-CoA C-acetyltransferase [Chloroflexota bacterium]
MSGVVVVSGARTAIGTFNGTIRDIPADELGATAIKSAVERAGIETSQVEHVVMGCTTLVGGDGHVARKSAVKAGVPVEVPALALNRMCGSGLEAINTGARFISSGDGDIVVAGGTESMDQAPFILRQARFGYRLGSGELVDTLAGGSLQCPFNNYHMGITAENVAEKYEVSREAQDEFALQSHQRAIAAIDAGRFKDQIVPVMVPQRGGPKPFDVDEHARRDTSLEVLSKLRPAFKPDGKVTAGNASGINDGAAALVLMSEAKAQELGKKPILRIVGTANVGLDPAYMGMGPVPAVRKVLQKTGLSLKDIDIVELNEAFASPAVACIRELGLDPEKVNVNGGAIALGHPVGATGAILTIKLMYELERRRGRYGIVTLCIGGGQGIATVFERV